MTVHRLHAIICDFNGVLADDETPHFDTLRQALREEGLDLSREEYYGRFLGMDDRNCTRALLEEACGRCHADRVERILSRKAALFATMTASKQPQLFPGVVPFVKAARASYPLAIASGGRRGQIEDALRGTPIEDDFLVIVSAEDTRTGKPDPEIYETALHRLNATSPLLLCPQDCLVIEDSRAGIRSAHRAGMMVVAVATTYPAGQLDEADLVIPGLDRHTLATVEGFFRERSSNSEPTAP